MPHRRTPCRRPGRAGPGSHRAPATDHRQSPPGPSSRILPVGDAGPDPPARMITRRPGTQLTAETGHPFPHAGQASAARPPARRLTGPAWQRRMTGLSPRRRRAGIVLDRDQHGTARRAHLHRHPAATAVLDHVGQRLLHHAVGGQRHRAGHRTDLAGAQRHHHPLPAHAAGQPLQVAQPGYTAVLAGLPSAVRAVSILPASSASRAVLDCTAMALSPWPTRSCTSRAIRSRSSAAARASADTRSRSSASARSRSAVSCARRDRTTVPVRAAIAVTAISSGSSPAVLGYSRALAANTAPSAAPPAAAAYHARAACRPWAPAAYSASHPAYGGTPGTATALTAYADTHTASTLTGRDRRHHSATPPISAAAAPTVSPAAPASTPGTGVPGRRAASCSAVTSTTSSTFPARAQRRRGAGWLTAAPVSHPQRTSHEAFHARYAGRFRGRWETRTSRSVPLAHDRPGIKRQRVFGDLVHPCVHINAVREVGKARPESAGSRMAMQGGV